MRTYVLKIWAFSISPVFFSTISPKRTHVRWIVQPDVWYELRTDDALRTDREHQAVLLPKSDRTTLLFHRLKM